MIDQLVISAVATVVVAVRLIRDLRTKAVVDGVERWSQRYGLSITDDVRAWLVRRRRSTSLGFALGLWVGMVAGGLVLTAPVEQPWSLQGGLAVQAGWWIAGGVGAVTGGALGARLTPASGPRVARGRAVDLADYVDPVDRTLPLIAAAIALGAGFVPLVEGGHGSAALSSAGAGAGSVVIVGIAEVLARLTVRQPQRAGGTHLLAWSDALRSETVRTSLGAATLIAGGSLIVSIPAAIRIADPSVSSGEATVWTGFLLVALVAAFWIRSLRVRPARHFLRRLWPVTAAELAEHERPLEEAAR